MKMEDEHGVLMQIVPLKLKCQTIKKKKGMKIHDDVTIKVKNRGRVEVGRFLI